MSYKSSARDFDEFMKVSSIWDDMLQELRAWLGDIHETMENADGDADSSTLHRLGGAAQAVRRFMEMPEMIKENIEEDIKEE